MSATRKPTSLLHALRWLEDQTPRQLMGSLKIMQVMVLAACPRQDTVRDLLDGRCQLPTWIDTVADTRGKARLAVIESVAPVIDVDPDRIAGAKLADYMVFILILGATALLYGLFRSQYGAEARLVVIIFGTLTLGSVGNIFYQNWLRYSYIKALKDEAQNVVQVCKNPEIGRLFAAFKGRLENAA